MGSFPSMVPKNWHGGKLSLRNEEAGTCLLAVGRRGFVTHSSLVASSVSQSKVTPPPPGIGVLKELGESHRSSLVTYSKRSFLCSALVLWGRKPTTS